MKQQLYETISDMGSIKIFNRGLSVFFANGIGDVPNTVKIYSTPMKVGEVAGRFIGHFTVKKARVRLSSYDCCDDGIHTFTQGRWFVNLEDKVIFHIYLVDVELNA